MEREFILEEEAARPFPRRPGAQRPVARPQPRPRPPRYRPFPAPVVGSFTAPAPADARPAAVRGCGIVLVLNGFPPEQARLAPRHYADLLQAALLLGRVRGSVGVEIVSLAAGGAGPEARTRAEEVRRQFAFLLGLAGLRREIRVGTATGPGPEIEIRVCVE